jgi:rSAM/selenodomain-associated transferase 1
MSKAPDPGKVKTRLVPLLGEEGAAKLYTRLLHDCLNMCTTGSLCSVDIWCSPSAEHPFFQQCRSNYPVDLHTQADGDLGTRMSNAFRTALDSADAAVMIGADCPTLNVTDIDSAFDALNAGKDIVIGPAEDGGYYLIGMREHHASIFEDIPWSTPEVLALTERRIQQQGLGVQYLTLRKDLDTPEDYAVYNRQELKL